MIIDKDKEQESEKFHNIMKMIQENEDAGMKEFYKEYGKFLCCVMRIFRGSSVTEQEILQEVLYVIWRNSKSPKFIENPKGWLYKITVNCAKGLLRARRVEYSLNENIVAKRNEIDDFLDRDEFDYLTRNLSVYEKQIVIKKVLAGDSFKEIAKDLKARNGSISTTYYRALKKIEKDLRKNF